MTERELILDYLWRRILCAWDVEKDEEAAACHRLYTHIEGMSNGEYLMQYSEPVEAGDIA